LKAKPAAKLPTFTEKQVANFLHKECETFCELLKSDPERARGEIQKRIKKLVLTPKETPGGAVLEVSGDIELLRTGDVLEESPLGESLSNTSFRCCLPSTRACHCQPEWHPDLRARWASRE
jgi:hypothetical protein